MTNLTKWKCALVLVFGVFVLIRPTHALADEPPTHGGPSAVVTAQRGAATEGYRLQMAAVYGVSAASILAGPGPFLLTAGFGPPLVHMAHENQMATAASLGVRVIFLASAMYWANNCFSISFSLDGSEPEEVPRPGSCDLVEAAITLSLIATPVIDFAMAYETLPPVKLGVLIRPPVRENPAFFGVGGVF